MLASHAALADKQMDKPQLQPDAATPRTVFLRKFLTALTLT
jgi:hypothetical protein